MADYDVKAEAERVVKAWKYLQAFYPDKVVEHQEWVASELQAALDAGKAAAKTRRFPIMGGPSIPWSMIEPHERQAKSFHDQSLERLAQRGGLAPSEALAVLDDVGYFKSKWRVTGSTREEKQTAARDELERRRIEYERTRGEDND